MHNTHLLAHVGQLNHTYFTHLAYILSRRNQLKTVNGQWPPLQRFYLSRHTCLSSTPPERHKVLFSQCKYSLPINATDRWNPILYLYYVAIAKSALCDIYFANLLPRISCNFCETLKIFLFPVKRHHGLDDFSTEIIICCFMQRVI